MEKKPFYPFALFLMFLLAPGAQAGDFSVYIGPDGYYGYYPVPRYKDPGMYRYYDTIPYNGFNRFGYERSARWRHHKGYLHGYGRGYRDGYRHGFHDGYYLGSQPVYRYYRYRLGR